MKGRIVEDYKGLSSFGYGGHGALMGKCPNNWQNTDYVLALFGRKASEARRSYSQRAVILIGWLVKWPRFLE